jgi:effector-binding domain-containing protein
MKIIKNILKWLLILIVLIVVVSFFLPSQVHVQRSIVIKAPADLVFGQINDLKIWQKWMPWGKKDTSMKTVYEANTMGLGAKYSWTSKQMGNGTMEITASIPADSIQTTMHFEGMGKSYGAFKFAKDSGGLKVTWSMDSKGEEVPFLFKVPHKYFNLFMDKMIGPDFESGLKDLKALAEAEAAKIPPPVVYDIKETEVKEQIICAYHRLTTPQTISADIGKSFGIIGEFTKKNKLTQAGPVLTIYHSYAPDKIDMECGVPVNKRVNGVGEVECYPMPATNTAMLNYYGAYDKMEGAHGAIKKWIKDNNKKMKGDPWEVYVTDPMNEKDTAKWLTEIYYPIE